MRPKVLRPSRKVARFRMKQALSRNVMMVPMIFPTRRNQHLRSNAVSTGWVNGGCGSARKCSFD